MLNLLYNSHSFLDLLTNNVGACVRYVREKIELQEESKKSLDFLYGRHEIKISIGDRSNVRLRIYKRGEDITLAEEELPALFVKHVRFFFSHMCWTIDKIKLIYEAKERAFFTDKEKYGMRIEKIVANWRATILIGEKEGEYHLYEFDPNGIAMHSIGTFSKIGTAMETASLLSSGRCLGCRIKTIPLSQCLDNSTHKDILLRAW